MSLAKHRELLVLGAVRSHSVHGYVLAEALASGLGASLGMKKPNVYALLKRLEQRGWLAHRSRKDSAYPERRVYTLTAAGKRAFTDTIRASARAGIGATVPLVVLVAHLDELNPGERLETLQRCRDQLLGALADLAELPEHEGAAGEALDLMKRHYELDLSAIRRALKRVRRGA